MSEYEKVMQMTEEEFVDYLTGFASWVARGLFAATNTEGYKEGIRQKVCAENEDIQIYSMD